MTARALLPLALAIAACGGDGDDDDGADARAGIDGTSNVDGAGVDGPAAALESEPNNASTADEVDPLDVPGAIRGVVDPADDLDVFAADLPVGSRWTYRIDGAGGQLAPHLAVTNHADEAPASVALADVGGAALLEHVVLVGGRHNFIVRDDRNVPAPSGVGGATHGYVLTATPLERAPVAATVPSSVGGMLTSPFAVALYTFTLDTETDVRIDVLARRLADASDLDTRASLVRLDDDAYLITNDDLDLAGQLDSRVEGVLPAGEYLLVVDNLQPDATDLRYGVDFTLR